VKRRNSGNLNKTIFFYLDTAPNVCLLVYVMWCDGES
jgi:hypothetical protein